MFDVCAPDNLSQQVLKKNDSAHMGVGVVVGTTAKQYTRGSFESLIGGEF